MRSLRKIAAAETEHDSAADSNARRGNYVNVLPDDLFEAILEAESSRRRRALSAGLAGGAAAAVPVGSALLTHLLLSPLGMSVFPSSATSAALLGLGTPLTAGAAAAYLGRASVPDNHMWPVTPARRDKILEWVRRHWDAPIFGSGIGGMTPRTPAAEVAKAIARAPNTPSPLDIPDPFFTYLRKRRLAKTLGTWGGGALGALGSLALGPHKDMSSVKELGLLALLTGGGAMAGRYLLPLLMAPKPYPPEQMEQYENLVEAIAPIPESLAQQRR